MKKSQSQIFRMAIALFLTALTQINAQSFSSGSNGSAGALSVGDHQSVTIQLPPDGILHYTTISIGVHSNVMFGKNAANTPVYMLATGDVLIKGRILVQGDGPSGQRGGIGGPGGFDGGNGGAVPSDGFGPGAGIGGHRGNDEPNPDAEPYRGSAGHATPGKPSGGSSERDGGIYSNSLLIPLIGGSGGGGGKGSSDTRHLGGGGGGGAILISSTTKITFTQLVGFQPYISIRGASGSGSGFGYGSGGALRIVAPAVEGGLTVDSGQTPGVSPNEFTLGGYGRVRVDSLNLGALNLSYSLGGLGWNGASYSSFGANMVVFPPNLPSLRVVQAAGANVPANQNSPLFVLLPQGSPSTQSVSVVAKDFKSVVPLVAVVTPEAGESTKFEFQIDNTAGGSTTGAVNVEIPAGVSTRIDVWTR